MGCLGGRSRRQYFVVFALVLVVMVIWVAPWRLDNGPLETDQAGQTAVGELMKDFEPKQKFKSRSTTTTTTTSTETRTTKTSVPEPTPSNLSVVHSQKPPVVRVEGNGLELVEEVFRQLGYVVTLEDDMDWDVLWSNEPTMYNNNSFSASIKPHQKVNHLFAMRIIASKRFLVKIQSEAIPKAFIIPREKEEFFKFVKDHPKVQWVQKYINHRGVRFRKPDEVSLHGTTIVQQFINNPLLIDGRLFSIAVYVVITSLHPLRLYFLNEDVSIRFCPKKYNPLQLEDRGTYVIDDTYMPLYQIPVLGEIYTKNNHTLKDAFNIYYKQQGIDTGEMWDRFHDIIREVVLSMHTQMRDMTIQKNLMHMNRNCFELTRFDFILDEDWNPYLLEVNMSPVLSPRAKPWYQQLYSTVITNTLRLAGLVPRPTADTWYGQIMQVFGDWCASEECTGCQDRKCALCASCLEDDDKVSIHDAYFEHLNRGSYRRAFPPRITREQGLAWTPEGDTFNVTSYNEKDQLMIMWYIGMCRKDETWCT